MYILTTYNEGSGNSYVYGESSDGDTKFETAIVEFFDDCDSEPTGDKQDFQPEIIKGTDLIADIQLGAPPEVLQRVFTKSGGRIDTSSESGTTEDISTENTLNENGGKIKCYAELTYCEFSRQDENVACSLGFWLKGQDNQWVAIRARSDGNVIIGKTSPEHIRDILRALH